MKCIIIGSSKSGKSELGESIVLKVRRKSSAIYIATMKPYDSEDVQRIENHINKRKGKNFITIEQSSDINLLEDKINYDDTVFIDSITSLLNNEMFKNNLVVNNVSQKIINDLEVIMNKSDNCIIISDYIFSDAITYDSITESYKKELANINKKLVSLCDVVIECSFGNIKIHKGSNMITGII